MTQLFNKIAWFVAVAMGFLITFSFTALFGGLRYLGDDEILIFLLFTFVFATIFKGIFLSRSYIKSRVQHFADHLPGGKKKEKHKAKAVLEEPASVDPILLEEVPMPEKVVFQDEIKNVAEKIDIPKQEEIEEENVEPSKITIYITQFFQENLLAKIGAILVFLGVLFLLSLVWSTIPNLGKYIIGFAVGFSFYFTGVWLDKKDIIGESRILLGTGLLINFLVILAGKHILEDSVHAGALISSGITFTLLILNTLFGVVTSYVYKSKTLLVFAFIFAYINPLLLGESGTTPYTLVVYSMIVSLGSIIIGYKHKNYYLQISGFILGNILFFIAPFSTQNQFVFMFIAMCLLGFITLWSLYKSKYSDIQNIFIANYAVLFLALLMSGGDNIFTQPFGFFTFITGVLLLFITGIFFFLKKNITDISTVMIIPMVLFIALCFFASGIFLEYILFIGMLSFLLAFGFLQKHISSAFQYMYFIVLAIFIFIINGLSMTQNIEFNTMTFYSTLAASFIFLLSSYSFSKKQSLTYLYTIGSIGSIILLSTIVVDQVHQNILSVAVVVFTLIATLFPFFHSYLLGNKANVSSLVITNIIVALFASWQLFSYGQNNFPGLMLGFAFIGLAIYYSILGYAYLQKIGMAELKANAQTKNTFYLYIASALSLFSFAIALIFSNSPEIIALVWTFEVTILMFFYKQTGQEKIFSAALLLSVITLIKIIDFADIVSKGEYLYLGPLVLIGGSSFLNLKFIDKITSGTKRHIHDILHIITMAIVGGLLSHIIISTGHGWSIFGVSIFIGIISYMYGYFSSHLLKVFLLVFVGMFGVYQIDQFNLITYNLTTDSQEYLIVLQYITTLIMVFGAWIFQKYNKITNYNIVINILLAAYILVIISQYIYHIIPNTFAITIFWGVVSISLLLRGIGANIIRYRTLGLYLLSLVLFKIFFYDLWYGLDDAITRVIALMVLGILLIVVSTQYSKRFGNNLLGEFHYKNLKK